MMAYMRAAFSGFDGKVFWISPIPRSVRANRPPESQENGRGETSGAPRRGLRCSIVEVPKARDLAAIVEGPEMDGIVLE